jgi:hypothetical protein
LIHSTGLRGAEVFRKICPLKIMRNLVNAGMKFIVTLPTAEKCNLVHLPPPPSTCTGGLSIRVKYLNTGTCYTERRKTIRRDRKNVV